MKMDLDHDHYLRFVRWAPDRSLNPQYKDLPDNDCIGAIVSHKKPDGVFCEASIMFECPQSLRCFPDKAAWTVTSWEPLTMYPSLLCHCGDHGYIRNGKWIPA